MTDEERKKKQIEKNAESFVQCHFKNRSYGIQNAVKEAYLLIVRDGIIY